MKNQFLILFLFLFSVKSFGCECTCTSNCDFKTISNNMEFVALIRIIEYSDFLEDEIFGYEGKMPYSMTVEIIKLYKGSESRKTIKIWGDNGVLCRPYTANFEIGKYYLIAPTKITHPLTGESKDDYAFFSCRTDYMAVDYDTKIAYGKYSRWRNKISLEKFEKKLKK